MQQMTGSEGLTSVQNRSQTQADNGGSKLDQFKTTVADKLKDAATALRQKSGDEGAAAGYASQASDWLDQAADYVRDLNPTEIKSNIQQQVHNNPGRSLLIAAGAGLALGILVRRR
jgi:ElaB/YqjD/DUF883 family membrane-anchored ribosome-binding protein